MTETFSIGEAMATPGRVIRRHPLAVFVWGFLMMGFSLLAVALMFGTLADLPLADGAEPPPEMFGKLMAVQGLSMLLNVGQAVLAVVIWHAGIIAGFGAVWFFLTHLGFVKSVVAHPLLTVGYTAAYFLVGGFWSVVKWWFEETARVRRIRIEFERQLTWPKPETSWETYIIGHKTVVRYHREDFFVWVAFWPFSAVWTLINDPVRRLVRRIVSELQQVYQRITDYVWKAQEPTGRH